MALSSRQLLCALMVSRVAAFSLCGAPARSQCRHTVALRHAPLPTLARRPPRREFSVAPLRGGMADAVAASAASGVLSPEDIEPGLGAGEQALIVGVFGVIVLAVAAL